MSYADAFVNRKRESSSKLQYHQDYLSKIIKDFNLQIEKDEADAFDHFKSFKKKDTPEKTDGAKPTENNTPGSPGILNDVSKIIERTKNLYRDWNVVEKHFLQANRPQPKKVDNSEHRKKAEDVVSQIKNRLFSAEEEEENEDDQEPKLESPVISKNTSKASFDLLKVSECVSVDISQGTNRKQEENTKNQIDLEYSTEVSHSISERRSIVAEEREANAGDLESQDPIERINRALNKAQTKLGVKQAEKTDKVEKVEKMERREALKEIQNNIETNPPKKSEASTSTKKKPLGENLANLGVQKKNMQSHFKERFAQLKSHYKAEIKVHVPVSRISHKQARDNEDNAQREIEPTASRLQTGNKNFQDYEKIAEESLEISSSSMIEEKKEEKEEEQQEKVRSEIKQSLPLPKTLDRYDNLKIELLDDSYVKKRLHQADRAGTPYMQQNLFVTPLKNVSDFEDTSELNYSHSLQEASFLLTDLAKHRGQKKGNNIEDYELTDQDKKVLEEHFQADLELQKLLKKRVFVQNKLE